MNLGLGLLALAVVAWGPVPKDARVEPALRVEWNRQAFVHKEAARRLPWPVLVEMGRALTKVEVQGLEDHGVRLDRTPVGAVAHVDRFYSALLTPHQLLVLLQQPQLRRVSLPPPATRPLPPDNSYGATHAWTRAAALWPQRNATGIRHQGTGVVIADMDGATDVFHPMFFRADAGLYGWIDVNDNGMFDPGTDAVDLDGNAMVDAGEVLAVLGGGFTDVYGQLTPTPGFVPAVHFLYADSNGNSQRDYGAAAGFTEATPAYGEPIFVADDLDGNAVLDVGEKLLRLGTSKFRGVFRPSTNQVYIRGTNLIEVPINTDPSHGSGTTGILAGGIFNRSAVQGLAPDAELIHIVNDSAAGETEYGSTEYQANMMSGLDWARSQGMRVLLHEYGTAIGHFADGSSSTEALIDTLSAQGVVQATAAHNFAGTFSRTVVRLMPNASADLPVTAQFDARFGTTFRALYGTLRWRGSVTAVSVSVQTPGMVQLDAQSENFTGRDVVFGSREVSPRGTGMVHFVYGRLNAAQTAYDTVPNGTYTLTIQNNTAAPVDVHAYLTDESAYGIFTEVQAQPDDTSSMAWPSTADSAIAVAAYQVNTLARVDHVGAHAPYSGVGPRLDGLTTITVSAPADHFGALADSQALGAGHYQVFDGTSGALPQVGAAVALLLQAEPTLTPEQVRERLGQSAWSDQDTGVVPNHVWGAGRLDVHALVTGQPAAENLAPVLLATAGACEASNGVNTVRVDASATTDDHDSVGQLRFVYDADYDGIADQEGTEPAFVWTAPAPGRYAWKVGVEDTQGAVSEARVWVTVEEPCASPAGSSSGGTSSGSAGDAPPAGCGGCSQPGAGPAALWLGFAWGLGRLRRRVRCVK